MSTSLSSAISVSGGGIKSKKESGSKPFGDDYFARLTKLLLMEDEQKAVKELGECVQMVMAAKLTPDQELWDSGDELGDGKPLQRKGTMPERIKTRPGEIAATTMTVGEALKRPLQMKKIEAEPRDKIRKLEGSEAAEFIIESTTNKKCSECKEGASTSTNAILGCEGCKTAYHMNCHKPPILPKEAADDRFLFLCSKCNTKPSAAHTSSSRSQSPKPRKEDDANKNEKSSAPKSDKAKVGKSTSNIAATFEEFRKKKLMKNLKKT